MLIFSRNGSSRQAILKFIASTYKVNADKHANSQLKLALKRGVEKNVLKQAKGSGASGSFRVNSEAVKKTVSVKPKKIATKKPKAVVKKTSLAKPEGAVAAKAKKAVAAKPAAAKKSSPVKKTAAVKVIFSSEVLFEYCEISFFLFATFDRFTEDYLTESF